MLSKHVTYFATIITISVLGTVYYFNKKSKNKVKEKSVKVESKVLFSSEEAELCKPHLGSTSACNKINCPVRTINELKELITSAKESVDICVYFLTSRSMHNAITDVFNKDVPVRIITDADMSKNTVSNGHIYKLRKQGIRVRTKQSNFHMHHKFAVIDKKILISGSTNWTEAGFFGNCENILITNDPDIVRPYSNEFERLWSIFDA